MRLIFGAGSEMIMPVGEASAAPSVAEAVSVAETAGVAKGSELALESEIELVALGSVDDPSTLAGEASAVLVTEGPSVEEVAFEGVERGFAVFATHAGGGTGRAVIVPMAGEDDTVADGEVVASELNALVAAAGSSLSVLDGSSVTAAGADESVAEGVDESSVTDGRDGSVAEGRSDESVAVAGSEESVAVGRDSVLIPLTEIASSVVETMGVGPRDNITEGTASSPASGVAV